MGVCDSSEFKLLESLKIIQMVLGSKHHKSAQVMDKLADLYKDIGKFNRQMHCLEGLKIFGKTCWAKTLSLCYEFSARS